MILDDIRNNLEYPHRAKQYSFIGGTDKKVSSKLTKMLNQDEQKTIDYKEDGHDDDCTATTLR